jgi:hypothetical protein
MMAANIHVEPAHDDGHGRVSAHRHEKEGSKLRIRVVMYPEQDDEPSQRDAGAPDGEQEAVADPVTQRCR